MSKFSYFIFHGSLNDFLPGSEYGLERKYTFLGNPSIKDAIEAQGVPYLEIGSIYINNYQVDIKNKIQDDDRIEVYPIQDLIIEENSLQFVVDSHLGKLARNLRILGFDSLYDKNFNEEKIANIADQNNRIVLTRNSGLLKNNRILRGYWLRSQDKEEQMKEVIQYFNLKHSIKPFIRCRVCNGLIQPVSKQSVENQLPQKTKAHFNDFYQCKDCSRVYWKGSHYDKMAAFIEEIKRMQF